MNLRTATLLAVLLSTLPGCTTVHMVAYQDGWVKTSNVSHRFHALPVLDDVSGDTYSVTVSGAESKSAGRIHPFDRRGMRVVSGRPGDVRVRLALGDFEQDDPGAIRIGSKWYPAFEVTVPYEVRISRGEVSLAQRSGTFSNVLSFRQSSGFSTREKAIEALDKVRQLAADGTQADALEQALAKAHKTAVQLANGLFAKRHVAVDVPVVRSAAGIDFEEAYRLLAGADGPEQIQAGLNSYETVGDSQLGEDDGQQSTARYGVACGIAAGRLLLNDLAGAWNACELASRFEPGGEEADKLRSLIYQQERQTGVRMIPDEARQQIEAATGVSDALQGLLENWQP